MIIKVFKTKEDKRAVYQCDECGKEFEVSWYYLKARNRLETQYCRSCTIKLQDVVNKRKNTCIEKYGCESPMQVEEFKKKYSEANTKVYEKQRVNFEDIKKSFEDANYQLLTPEYKNNQQKLECVCPKGHKFFTTWNSWSRGKTVCRECSSEEKNRKELERKQIKAKLKEEAKKNKPKRVPYNKFDYDYVKQFFEQEGYTLISDTYEGSGSKSEVICPNGHNWNIEFTRFKRGVRCWYCAVENRGISRRLKFEDVKKYFEDVGYTLLSSKKDYKSTDCDLKYRCPKGHVNITNYHRFSSGSRCPDCNTYKNTKYEYGEVKEYIEKEGYILLSDTYINNRKKLKLKCPENHECLISFYDFKKGNRCQTCFELNRGASRRLKIEDVREYFH